MQMNALVCCFAHTDGALSLSSDVSCLLSLLIYYLCSPEFLNRLDDIIVFRQLTKSEVKEIAAIMLAEVGRRAGEKNIGLEVKWGFPFLFLFFPLFFHLLPKECTTNQASNLVSLSCC
jgi:hypothetical protein